VLSPGEHSYDAIANAQASPSLAAEARLGSADMRIKLLRHNEDLGGIANSSLSRGIAEKLYDCQKSMDKNNPDDSLVIDEIRNFATPSSHNGNGTSQKPQGIAI
jgi:hypothetical protein